MTAAEYALAAGISIQEARRRAPGIPGARKVKPEGRVSPAVWEIPDSAISDYVISIPIERDPVEIEDPAEDEIEDILEGLDDKKKTTMIGILIGTVVALVGMIISIPDESKTRDPQALR